MLPSSNKLKLLSNPFESSNSVNPASLEFAGVMWKAALSTLVGAITLPVTSVGVVAVVVSVSSELETVVSSVTVVDVVSEDSDSVAVVVVVVVVVVVASVVVVVVSASESPIISNSTSKLVKVVGLGTALKPNTVAYALYGSNVALATIELLCSTPSTIILVIFALGYFDCKEPLCVLLAAIRSTPIQPTEVGLLKLNLAVYVPAPVISGIRMLLSAKSDSFAVYTFESL